MKILQRPPRWARGRPILVLTLVALLAIVAAGVAVGGSLRSSGAARVQVANLLADSEFESSPFAAYYTHGTGTFAWATDQSWTNPHSLKITSTQAVGSLSRWLSNTTSISARPGTTYSGSVYLKTQEVVQQANLSLTFWSSGGVYLGSTYDSQPASGTKDWSLLLVHAVAPSGTAFVRVEFRLWGPGTVWFDSASLSASGSGVPVNTAAPVITMTQRFPGYVFKATPGTWTNSPTAIEYAWYETPSDVGGGFASGTPIGRGDTLELNWPAHAGFITVGVTAANAAGATTAFAVLLFNPSEFTVVALPTITGMPRVGATLSTAGRGGYVGLGTGVPPAEYNAFRVTWVRCDPDGARCVPLQTSGQFDPSPTLTYVVTADDVGSSIRVLDWSGTLLVMGKTFMTASAPTAVVTR